MESALLSFRSPRTYNEGMDWLYRARHAYRAFPKSKDTERNRIPITDNTSPHFF
jgi:hypothetical protein